MALVRFDTPWDSQPQEVVELNPSIPRPAEFVNLAAQLPFGSVRGGSVSYGSGTARSVRKEVGIAFDGTYQSSFVTSQQSLQGPDARFSVVARLRKTTTGATAVITSRNNDFSGRTFALTDTILRATLIGTNEVDSTSFPSINDGEFHTVGMTCDGATTVFFLDGREISSHAYAFAGYATNNTGRIGEANGWGLTFTGDMAFVADWHEPLPSVLMRSLTANPWQLFAPRQIWIPASAASALPTLSNPTAINITASSFQPRVSYAF